MFRYSILILSRNDIFGVALDGSQPSSTAAAAEEEDATLLKAPVIIAKVMGAVYHVP